MHIGCNCHGCHCQGGTYFCPNSVSLNDNYTEIDPVDYLGSVKQLSES